ncbi:hypothetical protein DVH24_038857 [Malus domestica]|uniref:NB-ARC domain-containing protein n=1 Tax=Malus domestica TaxID=3750 RepID=A0A498KGH8_MALDO|nr:hypothetical protein DVH24_038857 [Malus domestica]
MFLPQHSIASLAAHQDFGMALGFKDELSKLNKSFSRIQDILACFQASTRSRQGSRGVAEDADAVFDVFQYEDLRHKVELEHHTTKKGTQLLLILQSRVNKASMICLVAKKIVATAGLHQRIRGDRETNAFFGKDERIVGREEVATNIVTALVNSNNQENLSVMAIVRMPGLGKTTLAKLVYNENEINRQFDKQIWVCVSNTFDVNKILSGILESLDPYEWDILISCMSKLDFAPCSYIIVITRSAKVASITETHPDLGVIWRIRKSMLVHLKDRAF